MNLDYRERIDKVIAYIEEHSSQPLKLDTLAEISHFSKFHFSRIFTAMVGVTPMAFVNRKRIQHSLVLLTETNKTILEVAGQSGFESVSVFNAHFKRYYGCTPGSIRNRSRRNSNFASSLSNMQAESAFLADYNRARSNPLLRRAWESMVAIRQIPEVEVAYIRHIGSYLDTYSAWDKLSRWADQQGIHGGNQQFIGISLDDGDLVEESACRYDACVTLPEGFGQEAHRPQVQFKTVSGGMYAVYSYYDTVDKLVLAYESMFSVWLPRSGYEADDRPCLEFCLNDPMKDQEGKCKVDLYIPIKQHV
ncbi:GyrI-like domain-containing protein [Paenibacillus sp. FSL H8-0259]|uniref:AraC family transcriptional regulator n=1 Tax=Paenibacillus sp. FSL H8-0259 TaxID=1920423 RepID=UPI00096D238C|nr:AraC family transcriptional regulator [Paenibacillus sp. FSL H8-0259]OMF22130.1 transcriptional regulator [Paenibacillus sp. FSL H8-0259]